MCCSLVQRLSGREPRFRVESRKFSYGCMSWGFSMRVRDPDRIPKYIGRSVSVGERF